jgi:predicted type IV restriction endonuclease
MYSELTEAIRDIRTSKALVSIDEASTKAGVVLRLLSALGWNPFNPTTTVIA